MNSKDYEKLNSYLNDIFLVLEKDDSFFTRNIVKISSMNDDYLAFISKYELSENLKENKLTYEEVYSISRKIIASIDKSYLTDYDDLIKFGRLDFGYDDEYDDSIFIHKHNLINIKREFNYNDVISLIHEFIHYTNGTDKKSRNRYLLTEFISIYFEIYAIECLLKQGISKEEISLYDRIKNAIFHANVLYNYELIFLAYEKFGNINENTSDDLTEYFLTISKEDFEHDCINFLNYITKEEIKYKNKIIFTEEFKTKKFIIELCSPFYCNYRYLLGTLLAFYARSYCKMEDIVALNNRINDSDIGNMNVVDVLEKVGIDLNDEQFSNKIFDSVDAFINEYTNQKSR